MLAENLLLLALDDDKGTIPLTVQTGLAFGLAGAVVVELALAGCVSIKDDRLNVVPGNKPDHPVLDDALELVAAKPDKMVAYWVHNLDHKMHTLRQKLLDVLVERGTLQEHEKRILFVFHRTVYPEHDARIETDVRQRLAAVLFDGEEGNARIRLLLQLATTCQLIDHLYGGQQRKAARKRVKQLEKQRSPATDAANEATQAAQATREAQQAAAAAAAAMLAATAAASAASASCAAAACS